MDVRGLSFSSVVIIIYQPDATTTKQINRQKKYSPHKEKLAASTFS